MKHYLPSRQMEAPSTASRNRPRLPPPLSSRHCQQPGTMIDWLDMNWLDILIAVLLAFLAFSGFRMGLIKAVFAVASLVIGVVLAGQFYDSLSERLTFIHHQDIANIVAFAIILALTVMAAGVAGSIVRGFISLSPLGLVDRLGGAIAGALVGAIIIGAILIVLTRFPYFDIEGSVSDSSLASLVIDRVPAVLGLLPGDFDSVRHFFK